MSEPNDRELDRRVAKLPRSIDPERDLYVVFLTNRVHPTRENNQIQRLRRALHDALGS